MALELLGWDTKLRRAYLWFQGHILARVGILVTARNFTLSDQEIEDLSRGPEEKVTGYTISVSVDMNELMNCKV